MFSFLHLVTFFVSFYSFSFSRPCCFVLCVFHSQLSISLPFLSHTPVSLSLDSDSRRADEMARFRGVHRPIHLELLQSPNKLTRASERPSVAATRTAPPARALLPAQSTNVL